MKYLKWANYMSQGSLEALWNPEVRVCTLGSSDTTAVLGLIVVFAATPLWTPSYQVHTTVPIDGHYHYVQLHKLRL